MNKRDLIVVRGGGDLATGCIHRLWSSGFRVLVLETDRPTAIRRQVSVCEAVYNKESTVEQMACVRIDTPDEMESVFLSGKVPLLVDPAGESIRHLKPAVVVDAVIAKKNLGTTIDMAPLTIALGPGFVAGIDVHYVIETMRGHNLGRILASGEAMKNTGVPGKIAGYAAERVIHAPATGILVNRSQIGDCVEQGQAIAVIKTESGLVDVPATIPGLLRGLIRDGFPVTKGLKIADIDPRESEYENCFTISDKARCLGGSVLELVCAQLLQHC